MSESPVRVLLRIPAKLKAILAELAEREHRSLNKQIEFLLERSVQEEKATEADDALPRRGGRRKQK